MFDNTPEDDASVGQPRLSEQEVRAKEAAFPFNKFSRDTFFHDRRTGRERRDLPETEAKAPASVATPPAERRVKKERRRRIDPTTFEKQYTDDEMEFMNAMQRFKVHAGISFPSHKDVLRIAHALGYRKVQPPEDDADLFPSDQDESADDCAEPLQEDLSRQSS